MNHEQYSYFRGEIRALSNKGLGVVDHPDGRIFFVRGGWPGEVGTFNVSSAAKSYSDIQAVEWHSSAPGKVDVPCSHYGTIEGKCGGCPWLNRDYATQIEAKETRLSFILTKNKITPSARNPIIPSPKQFDYRNRAQFKTDGTQLGYVSEGTNILAPIEDCLVLNEKMREILKSLLKQLPNNKWIPIKGFSWSYLEVDDKVNHFEIEPNRRRPFRQGNSFQNENMKNWIEQVLKKYPVNWPVVEAFCGSGNFTEVLSKVGFQNILAAEIRGSAIEELKGKKIEGVQVLEIDMNRRGVWGQISKKMPDAKILLIDPPREGVESRKDIVKSLKSLETIIYISCELTTWSRDVKDLIEQGWQVEQVTPLDLFPNTPHVELLSVLVKK